MPRDGSPPSAPVGYDDLFADFLATTLDIRPPPRFPQGLPMEAWETETARLLAAAGPLHFQRREDREACLIDTLEATAPLVSDVTIQPFAASRLDVTPVPDFRELGDRDICYTKINHGFWEQLYAYFAPPDPVRIRITNPARLQGRYITSGFLDALVALLRAGAWPEFGRVRFPSAHLGVSLASGTHDHSDVLTGFEARPPEQRKIVMGTAIGLAAWFETLFPEHRPAFYDGSFPKRGLETGGLRATLAWAAADSARIIFVVPPHLEGIRLADTTTPQETFLVPGTTIHESWAACLHAVAGHVFGRLADDGRVLVITQSAVFSAVLGFFLVLAKPQLLPATSRLRYFDLGQVLDIATPHAGGPWARQHAKGDISLFHVAAP